MSDPFADELSRFDDEYKAEPGRRPGLDVLPDGDYDFSVASADLGHTEKKREPILRVLLKLGSGPSAGLVVEYAYILTSQQTHDRLGSDLATLGFDSPTWTAAAGKPFSRMLPLAVPKLKGIRFRGHKKENKDGSKVYHNLYINARLGGPSAPPPSMPAPAAQPRPPAQPTVFQQSAYERSLSADEIPF